MRQCWTCNNEHDLDAACPQSLTVRTARAAGGTNPFQLPEEMPLHTPVFTARFDGECSRCFGAIYEGDEIRSDNEGGYIHAETCMENE